MAEGDRRSDSSVGKRVGRVATWGSVATLLAACGTTVDMGNTSARNGFIDSQHQASSKTTTLTNIPAGDILLLRRGEEQQVQVTTTAVTGDSSPINERVKLAEIISTDDPGAAVLVSFEVRAPGLLGRTQEKFFKELQGDLARGKPVTVSGTLDVLTQGEASRLGARPDATAVLDVNELDTAKPSTSANALGPGRVAQLPTNQVYRIPRRV